MDLAARLQYGKWGVFEDFDDGNANLIYVDDLIASIFLALSKEEANGELFNVAGGQPPTWNEYFNAMNDALGLPPLDQIAKSKSRVKTRIMHVTGLITLGVKARFEEPLMEIYMRNGFAGRMMRKLKGELDSTPSLGELTDLYCRQVTYCDEKIRTTLGYENKFELADGIAATVAWLERHELVPIGTASKGKNFPASKLANYRDTEVGA
jgi:nucleoside-diphosphate-sugar epimerase